jgi:molybdate transport system substrate-binding protein
LVTAALVLVMAGGGCGNDRPKADTRTTRAGGDLGEITVFAAASLTAAYTELGKAFETTHPGSKVTFSFAASSTLTQQITQGAPADVLATADEANLQKVIDAGGASDPKVFARNRLELAVGQGNPKKLTGLADLAKGGVLFVLCAPEVPCGRFGVQALAKAGVTAKPKSFEDNVKAVLTKVSLGEADAGIVYVTDVRSSGGKVEGVTIPDAENVLATYPVAVLTGARNPEGARAFVELVLSHAGRQVLAGYGFLSP